MAHREFTDGQGTPWQVWDVIPHAVRVREDRRLNPDRRYHARRHEPPEPHEPDRRKIADRRILPSRRHNLRLAITPSMEQGWLCFESPTEKRRLAPVPADWHRLPVAELERLCHEAAAPAPRRRR